MLKAGDKQTLIILALALLIFFAGLAILVYPTFRPHVSTAPIGQVLWIRGKVSSRLAQSSIWFGLSKNDKLYEGQWIRTGPDSRISLKLGDHEHFILPPNQEIILSHQIEKRKSLIDFKVSENEANSATDIRTEKTQIQQHYYSKRLVEVANQITPKIIELRIIWPKQGETIFHALNQPIHFFWQGPSDGLFEIRIRDVETSKQQVVNVGNTHHFSWLPSKDFGKKLALQLMDRKHNLKSNITEFLVSESPTIMLKSPSKTAGHIVISPSQPIKILVEPNPQLSAWRGELLVENKKIPLLFSNYETTLPFRLVERIIKHPRSIAAIKIQADWQQNISGQVISTPIEENWIGQIELVTNKWWQELGEQKSIFTCNEDKKEWICQNPIRVKIAEKISFISTEIVLPTGQTLEHSLDENQVISFCPATPVGDLKYKIRLRSDSSTIKYESDWIQASTKIEDKPEIITAKTIKADNGEFFNMITTKNCRDISLDLRLLDEQDNIIHQLSDYGSTTHIVTSQRPAHVEVAYVNADGQGLSAAMTTKPTFKSLICESQSSETRELAWSLKDNGKVYISAKNTRPWTLLNWKASKKFDEFEVQIASDDSFNNIIAQQITAQKSVQLILEPSWKKIYWRVRGLSVDEGPSAWSQAQEITIFKLQNETRGPNPRISKPQE